MLAGAFLLCIAVMALFPRTPFAGLLRAHLAEPPARWLNAPGKTAKSAALILLFLVVCVLAPETLLLAGMLGDALLAMEIVLAVTAAGAMTRLRAVRAALECIMRPFVRAARVIRAGRARRRKAGTGARPGRRSEDPEPGFGWALA